MRTGSKHARQVALALLLGAAAACSRSDKATLSSNSGETNNVAATVANISSNSAPVSEKIEFSSSSSTAANLPRPNARKEEFMNRFEDRKELSRPDLGVDATPVASAAPAPTKAATERLMRDWDRKKNWAVPGAQEKEDDTAELTRTEMSKEGWDNDKKRGVMETYLKDGGKKKPDDPRSRELALDNGRDDKNERDPLRDKSRDRNDDPDSRNEKVENGLAEFNLKAYIRAQRANDFLKDNPLPQASQMFRSDFNKPRDFESQRQFTERRERDAASSAEFMQMIKPRTDAGGISSSLAFDPLNAPDQTRRDLNPVMPREESSRPASGPFTGPSVPSRSENSGFFGATGPGASSVSPVVNNPSRPSAALPSSRAQSIILPPVTRPIN